MARFNSLADVDRAFDDLINLVQTLATATPQNRMELTGTIRLAGDGQIVIPWGGGSASLVPTLSGVNGRMNPGGDMHSWATSISQVANSAHGVATSAQSTANGAAASLAPGGATNNWITAVSSVANAAHSIASGAASAASAAQSAASAAQSTANGAAGTASSAYSRADTAQEMVRQLRRDVRQAGVAVPA